MENLSKIKFLLKKDKRDPKLYIPIIKLFKKQPQTISEISQLLNFSYSVTKQRLHKLERMKVIKRLKRGIYINPILSEKFSSISQISSKPVKINGSFRITISGNTAFFTLYNSLIAKKCRGKYCHIIKRGGNEFEIRKSNKYYGNKIHCLKNGAASIPVSRKIMPKLAENKITTKCFPIKLILYPEEWGLSINEIFSTEAKEEGELAHELNKLGIVEKVGKKDNVKSDIYFIKNNFKIPIEVTIATPGITGTTQNRSSIKSCEILARMYYSIKWNITRGVPTILVINEKWKDVSWVAEEINYLKRFHAHILFTDFQEGWAKKMSKEIETLTDYYLDKSTTRLGLE